MGQLSRRKIVCLLLLMLATMILIGPASSRYMKKGGCKWKKHSGHEVKELHQEESVELCRTKERQRKLAKGKLTQNFVVHLTCYKLSHSRRVGVSFSTKQVIELQVLQLGRSNTICSTVPVLSFDSLQRLTFHLSLMTNKGKRENHRQRNYSY